MEKKNTILAPGLGDAILTIEWWKKYYSHQPLYTTSKLYRKELFDLMDVQIGINDDEENAKFAGHGFPVLVEKKTHKRKRNPRMRYTTYQFDGVSKYPGAPHLKSFDENQIASILSGYDSKIPMVNVGKDSGFSLDAIINLMLGSERHVGADSGMAWLSLVCDVPAVDVWYNGYAEPSKWDCNWPLTLAYNGARIRFSER